jgi:hypothetical protein
MSVQYLKTRIAHAYQTPSVPRYGMTADGYTKRSGAPTSWMIRLDGEKRYRRLMVWQFSNAGTLFVRVRGECLVVNEFDIPR